jgi:RsiW-degrading membrane proteinase PrsW (M82 family)
MPYPYPGYPGAQPPSGTRLDAVKGGATAAVSGVNRVIDDLTGHAGGTMVSFRRLFADTFKRHTKQDIDSLLYSGTAAVALDPRPYTLPWLYARVGGILLATFLTLWLTYEVFRGSGNVIPGLIFTGALVVPASLMIFFWEANQARNISLFDLIRIFFIGGAMSILLTFIIGEIVPADVGSSMGEAALSAIFIGVTEETAKVLVVFFLIRRLQGNLILNGLLVGAAVGTGFAVFETAGYGTAAWLEYGEMAETLLVRGLLSIGGHVVWAGMAGAALMLAQSGAQATPTLKGLAWGRFLPLFAVAVALHAVWDFFCFVIASDATLYLCLGVLIVIAWVFVVRLINSGLRQQALADQGGVASGQMYESGVGAAVGYAPAAPEPGSQPTVANPVPTGTARPSEVPYVPPTPPANPLMARWPPPDGPS